MSKQSKLFASFIATGKGNLLTPRERHVITQIAEGVHFDVIAESIQVTRERIRQIACKAARHVQRIQREEESAKRIADLKAVSSFPLEIPLDDLDFPIRLYYSLLNLRVEKLGDIVKLGRLGLLRGRGIGHVYMRRIEDTLIRFGIELPLGTIEESGQCKD